MVYHFEGNKELHRIKPKVINLRPFMLFRAVLIVFFIFICSTGVVRSQEMLGTTLGNYAGINSVQLNPSLMHNSKLWLDIELTGTGMFIQNNYLYLSRSEFVLWDLFKPGYVLPSHLEDYGVEVRSFYRYDNSGNKNLFLNARINGPGVMINWGDHAFGLHTTVRSVSTLRNIPYHLANFLYLGLNYPPQQDINYHSEKPFLVSQMSWFEAGISYAYKVYEKGFDRFDAGISVRKLFGFAGLYMAGDNLDYIVPDDTTIQINNLKADYGFSIPVDYSSNEPGMITDPLFSGGGWGFDLGVTYTRLRKVHQQQYFERLCEQKHMDYVYRIGLSLIDVGGVKFKERAQTHRIDNRSSTWENLSDFSFQTINQLMDTISYKFYGDESAAYTGDRFTLWLPSALSVQFDYHHFKNWYINGSLFLPVQFSQISLQRPAMIAITPRYESRWFEANLPVSLYDWHQLRLGLSLRFYILTIGTEKLGPYFGIGNFNGMDIYFTIKIPFEKGFCRLSGSSKTCPAYDNY